MSMKMKYRKLVRRLLHACIAHDDAKFQRTARGWWHWARRTGLLGRHENQNNYFVWMSRIICSRPTPTELRFDD